MKHVHIHIHRGPSPTRDREVVKDCGCGGHGALKAADSTGAGMGTETDPKKRKKGPALEGGPLATGLKLGKDAETAHDPKNGQFTSGSGGGGGHEEPHEAASMSVGQRHELSQHTGKKSLNFTMAQKGAAQLALKAMKAHLPNDDVKAHTGGAGNPGIQLTKRVNGKRVELTGAELTAALRKK